MPETPGLLQPHVSDLLIVRVEIPKGQRNKYEWDEELDAIVLDRLLFSSVSYPTDYGFIPARGRPTGTLSTRW